MNDGQGGQPPPPLRLHLPAAPATSRRDSERPDYQPPAYGAPSGQPLPPPGYAPPGGQPVFPAPAQPPATVRAAGVPPDPARWAEGAWWRPLVGVLVARRADVRGRAGRGADPVHGLVRRRRAGRGRRRRRGWSTSTTRHPLSLAYLKLVLATAIPVAWFVIRVFHGLRPRWLSSVVPRMRWTFLLVCFGLSFVALFVTILLVGPAAGSGHRRRDEPAGSNDFTSTTARLPARRALAHAPAGGGGGVRVPRLPHPGVRRPVPQPDRGRGDSGHPVRARARARPERADLLRPVRLRSGRRRPRHR